MATQDNIPVDAVPSTARPQACPDCGCPPHRHANPGRDRVCNICGCPDLRVAKAERDSGLMGAHGDSSRPAQGFY